MLKDDIYKVIVDTPHCLILPMLRGDELDGKFVSRLKRYLSKLPEKKTNEFKLALP